MLSLTLPCWPRPQVASQSSQGAIDASISEADTLSDLNKTILEPGVITAIAADYLKLPTEELRKIQQLHLKIVRYSSTSETHWKAASNAISILNKTGFPFHGLSLTGVRIRYANLSHTALNHVDFTGADLTGVNFTESTFVQTNFNGSNFDKINFGIDLYFKHGSNVVQMAMFPKQKWLVSLDEMGLYIWDLEREELLRQEPPGNKIFKPGYCHLLVSPDEKYILRAYRDGNKGWRVDIVDSTFLKSVTQDLYSGIEFLYKFLLTADGQYIVANKNQIGLWELIVDVQGVPHFELKNRMFKERLKGDSLYAYHYKTNRIAIYSNNRILVFSLANLELLKSWVKPEDLFLKKIQQDFEFAHDGNALFLSFRDRIFVQHFDKDKLEVFCSEKDSIIEFMGLIPGTTYLAYTVDRNPSKNALKIHVRDIKEPKVLKSIIDFECMSLAGFRAKLNMIVQKDNVILSDRDEIVRVPLKKLSANGYEPAIKNVCDVRFSSDNNLIFVLDGEGTLHHFRSFSGQPVSGFQNHPKVKREDDTVSVDSKADSTPTLYLFEEYCTQDKKKYLRIYQVGTGQYHQIERTDLAYAISQDTRYIVFLRENGLELWDVEKKRSLGKKDIPVNKSCDTSYIVVSQTVYPSATVFTLQNNLAMIWQIEWEEQNHIPATLRAKFEHNIDYNTLEFSPLGNPFGGVQAEFWNRLYEGAPLGPPKLHAKFVGDKLYLRNLDRSISCRNLSTQEVIIFRSPDFITSYDHFDVSDDGKFIVGVRRADLIMYDTNGNQWPTINLVTECGFKATTDLFVKISSNGRFVSCWGEHKIFVWENLSGHLKLLWRKPRTFEILTNKIDNIKKSPPNILRLLDKYREDQKELIKQAEEGTSPAKMMERVAENLMEFRTLQLRHQHKSTNPEETTL